MGVVYEAYDPQLDRVIALKLLHADATHDLDSRQQLLREAKLMAKVSHPNVAIVYDSSEHQERVFLALELVSGPTLRTWLQDREKTWEALGAMLHAVGEGLVAAHAQGLVHRDFKPENVLIGADNRPRVIDFGLARPSSLSSSVPTSAPLSLDATTGGSPATTVADGIAGTPAYMAAEQIEGRIIDARCDQFAYCVTLAGCGESHRAAA